MAKFHINFVRTRTYDCYYTMEAENADDARRIAENMAKYDWAFQDRIDNNSVDHGDEYEIGEVLEADDDCEVDVFFNE